MFGRKEWQESADALEQELAEARVTAPREIPADVVTMNSRVRIRSVDGGGEQVVNLVFPRELHAHVSNVCILDPMGLALFGRRAGDVYLVQDKSGESAWQVDQILYQPEAAGEFQL
ncbi:MAG: GreA/GreB family elongation factor [Candidatus Hydrogenedentes bacterium]|nr:GreA/GreB family elongation factor [Candidatus Hydrogenedentota bacterium]